MTPDDPTGGGGGGGVGAWLGRSIDWLHQLGTPDPPAEPLL